MLLSFCRAASALCLTIPLLFVAAGCESEDTGVCCVPLSPEAEMVVPTPDNTMVPKNLVGRHPAFDCEGLTCVSWQGSDAFCTRSCNDGKRCPAGFECESVLESSPGAGAGIQPGDTFCVRAACSADGDCPSEFTCALVHASTGPADPDRRVCVRASDACE